LEPQRLPAVESYDASGSTTLSTQADEENRSWIFESLKQNPQQGHTEEWEETVSEVLTEDVSTRQEYPYPTAAEKMTQSSKNTRRLVSQHSTGPVHDELSTQKDLEPSVSHTITKSGHFCYPEPFMVVNDGIPGLQCPFCARTFAESFGQDQRRWRLVCLYYALNLT
jgi:hypothetical protein